jgi:acyl-CoA dehydrogenase
VLEERHRAVVDSIDRLIEREVAPIAERIDREDFFPENALRALGAGGYLGGVLPPPHGQGADLLSFALVVERLAAVSPPVAWSVVVHVSASAAVANGGSEEQKQRLLPALARGERLASFAFTEAGAGADWFAGECTARAEGELYRVNGAKTFISLATNADVFVTLVATQRDGQAVGLSMLAVEAQAPGLRRGSRYRGTGMRGIGWGELVFEDCAVPVKNRLGEEGKGARVVFGMAAPYLLGAAAIGVGIGSGALDWVRGHLKERTVRGKPIGGVEALQFRLADLSARLEAARALLYRACLEDPRSPLPFQAKLFATETALDLTRAAMQLGGAHGYTEGSRVERLSRDAYAVTLHFENNDFLRRFLGRTVAGV